MKTRCAVYQYYKNDRPIGYCNLDLSDLDNLTISYSTYRRLCRLCDINFSFYIVAPIDREHVCLVEEPGSIAYCIVRVLPNIER